MIICTVTNDLSTDQRMQRICTSLQRAGYSVTLVGRNRSDSRPLTDQAYEQHRLQCFFNRGMLFYAEYNIRLLFYLWRQRPDIIGSTDLDTLPAGILAARFIRAKCTYDAHEYFTEVPELQGRPFVQRIWKLIERWLVPKADSTYTVSASIAEYFRHRYGISAKVVRNLPVSYPLQGSNPVNEGYLLYQGALNEGRGLEALIEAVSGLEVPLWLAGEGDLSDTLRRQVQNGAVSNVRFLGKIPPEELPALTRGARCGFNLLEDKGLSYRLSLSNKFFDYMMAGIPQICIDFPEYRAICEEYPFALLVPDLNNTTLTRAIQTILRDTETAESLKREALKARLVLNWEGEEQQLLNIYSAIDE